MSQVAGAYPGFYLPLDGMLIHHRTLAHSNPIIKYAGAHFYTWGERGTVIVKCLAQKHKTTPSNGTQTKLDPESNTLMAVRDTAPLNCHFQ